MSININNTILGFNALTISSVAITSEFKKLGLACPKKDALATLVRCSGMRSQSDVSRLALNLTGSRLHHTELTELLSVAFPTAKIGERHGKHYMSLARTGKIDGINVAPAKAMRPKVGTPKTAADRDEAVKALSARLATLKGLSFEG